jgi:sugar phosphate isomerase/epimerase
MTPGIFSRTYPSADFAEVLARAAADGFGALQLNLSSFGMESLPGRLDAAALRAGRALARQHGIGLAALSGTWNMAHPDPDYRAAMRPRFAMVLEAAALLEVRVVTLCTGSRHAANMWEAHPDNAGPEAWADLCGELAPALEQAAALGLALAVEPEPGNVVCDAAAARRLLDELAAPNLKIILDAANLIGAGGLRRQAGILDEALDLLGPEVVLAHGKDIDRVGHVTCPGRGAIDLGLFAAGLRRRGFDGPLIGHGFAPEAAGDAARVLAGLCRGPG